MRDTKLFIDHVGSGKAPEIWFLRNKIEMQRLYYIKNGTGYYSYDNKEKLPFLHNCVYVFPYNIKVNFETVSDDRIDHIYFDFISYPPVISPSPIVYNIENDEPLRMYFKMIDSYIEGESADKIIPYKMSHVIDAPPGTRDEKCQIFYQMLKLVLTMLDSRKPLLFSDDTIINDVLAYIRNNYMNQLTVSGLATHYGFSENHFIRRFKAIMGITPYSYIKSYKLICAGELLSLGKSMSDVADIVGYDNASSLSRAMKDYNGSV